MTLWLIGCVAVLVGGWFGGLFARSAVASFIEPFEARFRGSWVPWVSAAYCVLLFYRIVPQVDPSWNDTLKFILLALAHLTFFIMMTQDALTMYADVSYGRLGTMVAIVFAFTLPDSVLGAQIEHLRIAQLFTGADPASFQALIVSALLLFCLTVCEMTSGDSALRYIARRGLTKGMLVYALLLKSKRRPNGIVPFLIIVQFLNATAWCIGGAHWRGFYLAVSGASIGYFAPWILAVCVGKFAKRQAMGSGDISFLMFVGAMSGGVGAILSLFLGALVAIGLLLCGACGMKSKFVANAVNPFLPGLVIAAWMITFSWPLIPVSVSNWLMPGY